VVEDIIAIESPGCVNDVDSAEVAVVDMTCKGQLSVGGIESVGERSAAAPGYGGADGLGVRAAGSDENDELLGAVDAGVEQVALEHHPGRGRERDHHAGIFASLGAVDGDRVGVGEFVEFGE